MERYHTLSRTFPLLGAQSREQAVVYLLALAGEKPVFLNSMAALMKVTAAADVHAAAGCMWCGYSSQTVCVEFGKCGSVLKQRAGAALLCAQCTRCGEGCMLG